MRVCVHACKDNDNNHDKYHQRAKAHTNSKINTTTTHIKTHTINYDIKRNTEGQRQQHRTMTRAGGHNIPNWQLWLGNCSFCFVCCVHAFMYVTTITTPTTNTTNKSIHTQIHTQLHIQRHNKHKHNIQHNQPTHQEKQIRANATEHVKGKDSRADGVKLPIDRLHMCAFVCVVMRVCVHVCMCACKYARMRACV